ncbi:putative Cache_3-Cache_2 domain-containing protein [Azospirillaceae bacterium]
MRFALWLGIAPGVISAVLGYLTFHELTNNFNQLNQARVNLVIQDIRQITESQINIGASIQSANNLQEILERKRGSDKGILSIEIFDQFGVSVHNTDRGLIGEHVPESWVAVSITKTEGIWSLMDQDAQVVGVTLQNSHFQPVGGVSLRYSLEKSQYSVRFYEETIQGIALSFICAFASVFLSIKLGLTSLFRTLKAIYASLKNDTQQTQNHLSPSFSNLACENDSKNIKHSAMMDKLCNSLGESINDFLSLYKNKIKAIDQATKSIQNSEFNDKE